VIQRNAGDLVKKRFLIQLRRVRNPHMAIRKIVELLNEWQIRKKRAPIGRSSLRMALAGIIAWSATSSAAIVNHAAANTGNREPSSSLSHSLFTASKSLSQG
jgi:hypothetical protein